MEVRGLGDVYEWLLDVEVCVKGRGGEGVCVCVFVCVCV